MSQTSTNAVSSRCLRAGIVQTLTVEFDDLKEAHQGPMGTLSARTPDKLASVIPARNLIG
jgi:hypothetical protein